MSERFFYILESSRFGDFGVVWRESGDGPKVTRICLPGNRDAVMAEVRAFFPGASKKSCDEISEFAGRIQRYLKGETVGFDITLLDRRQCGKFQKRVLLAEYRIPRGWVSTYGRVAAYIGKPKAYRAVGTALGRNPFPIVIPCHRAVQADGSLGGFRGGLAMKRAFLEMEGVKFLPNGKVMMERVYF